MQSIYFWSRITTLNSSLIFGTVNYRWEKFYCIDPRPFADVYKEVLELVEATTEQMVEYQVKNIGFYLKLVP